jgi:ABC-type glutathione transport system ATPase component
MAAPLSPDVESGCLCAWRGFPKRFGPNRHALSAASSMANSLAIEDANAERLLRVEALSKRYVSGGRWAKRTAVAAVSDATFEIVTGKTLALVGPSGCGKSTVARCVARLERPDSGRIWFDKQDIAHSGNRTLLPIRNNIQMIFQDAVTSLNPRFSAAEAIEEPLRIQGGDRFERRSIAESVMQEVALSPPGWIAPSCISVAASGRGWRLRVRSRHAPSC